MAHPRLRLTTESVRMADSAPGTGVVTSAAAIRPQSARARCRPRPAGAGRLRARTWVRGRFRIRTCMGSDEWAAGFPERA